jgi:aromatic-L-amino-acid decarboxylase
MTLPFEVVKESYPSIWLHIDAAWAGVTLSCPKYREIAQLPGINEHADSLCINFHKVTVRTKV